MWVAVGLKPQTSRAKRALVIDRGLKLEVEVLKELTWHYVIERPALSAQQQGKRTIIKTLFDVYWAASAGDLTMLPPAHQERLSKALREAESQEIQEEEARVRSVCDIICSMTDEQAVKMCIRLTGASLGSVLDPIV